MRRTLRSRRELAAFIAVLAAVSLVALSPRLGRTSAQQFWTEQPPAITATPTAPPWVELAKALKPAVVNISTRMTAPADEPASPNDLSDLLGRFQGQPAPRVRRGLGSGFLITPDGTIVTNNHVVDGASEIKVKMSDGHQFTAKVMGRDPKTDLALVKLNGSVSNLPVIPLGDTAQLQVGEPVMAIGNPFGLEQTVTTGIVSATGRVIGEGPYDDFIQTDAAINPGNSGGPLINARGQAVGINTAIFSRTGGSVGVGFAIPINLAKGVITQLATTGHVERGWLGVTVQGVTPELAKSFGLPESHGALVSDVAANSPAAAAGLKRGDVIVAYGGRDVARAEDLPRAVADTPAGHQVPVTIVRDGKRSTVDVSVAQLKDEEPTRTAQADKQGSLGLAVQTVTPDVARELGLDQSRGVLIRSVRDDSPAATAGLQAGDVIVSVDRHPITNVDEMKDLLRKHTAGTPTLFLVHRDGGNLYVPVG